MITRGTDSLYSPIIESFDGKSYNVFEMFQELAV